MSISTTEIVSDIQEEFEGGASLSVSWNTILRRAGQKLLRQISPDAMKTVVPVYGGVAKDLIEYYMPSEIATPAYLYTNEGVRKWQYVAPQFFFNNKLSPVNKFTIKSRNGKKFLYIRHNEANSMFTLHEMDSITGLSGTVTPTLDDRDYVQGSGSVKASFTDAGLYYGGSFSSVQDITDYLKGILLLPMRFDDASDVASIELQLRTDDSNYYSFNTTADTTPYSNIVDLWNLVRFSAENVQETGSPTPSSIAEWRLYVTASSGETVVVHLDRIALQKAPPLYLEGYDDRVYHSTAGVKTASPDYSVDLTDLTREELDILHYEACLLVTGASQERKAEFSAQLARAYENYYDNHPSEEQPMTYNIAPDMQRETLAEGDLGNDIFREWDTSVTD